MLVPSLMELQELEITIEESRIVHKANPPEKLSHVRRKIAKLRQSVPADVLRRYDRFREGGLGVVRESGGFCGNCHLRVPVGDLGRMRRGEMPWLCPNCGRFLLLDERKAEGQRSA